MSSSSLRGHVMTWVHLHTCRKYTHIRKIKKYEIINKLFLERTFYPEELRDSYLIAKSGV